MLSINSSSKNQVAVLLMLFSLCFIDKALAQDFNYDYNVQYAVDMGRLIRYGAFSTSESKVSIRGTFNGDDFSYKMEDPDGDGIYKVLLGFPNGNLEYSFFIENALIGRFNGYETGDKYSLEVNKSVDINAVVFRTDYEDLIGEQEAYLKITPIYDNYYGPADGTTSHYILYDLELKNYSINELAFTIEGSPNIKIEYISLRPDLSNLNWTIDTEPVSDRLINVTISGNQISYSDTLGMMAISIDRMPDDSQDASTIYIKNITVNKGNEAIVYFENTEIRVTPFIPGDVDRNEKINENDKRVATQFALHNNTDSFAMIIDYVSEFGDITGDGNLSMLDVYRIDQYLKQLIKCDSVTPLATVSATPTIDRGINTDDQSWYLKFNLNSDIPIKSVRIFTRAKIFSLEALTTSINVSNWELDTFYYPFDLPTPSDGTRPMNFGIISRTEINQADDFEFQLKIKKEDRSSFKDGVLFIDKLQINEQAFIAIDDSITFNFEVLGIDEEQSITKEIKLYPNYPNPFNPSTIIKFNLPSSTRVDLSVYSIDGKLVSQLVNRELSSGLHEVSFDGTGMSSGVYFYRLSTNSVSLTNKMILIK
ncbi:T9SS type A sorting domain-containing protein [bacterium]|nr:MAG: T9SS type A sorting domain-containing protein [bacterium]